MTKKYEYFLKLKDTIIKDDLLLRPLKFDRNKYRNFSNKICIYCGREYKPTQSRQHSCLNCYKISTCESCNSKYISICSYKDKKESYYRVCSKACSDKLKTKNRVPDSFSLKNMDKYTEINSKNLAKFKNLAGVWCKYDVKNNIVLDVMLTLNIYKEYNRMAKELKETKCEKYLEFDEISENIAFFFISHIKDWNDGLIKELDFALETNAKYWKPSSGLQTKLYNESKEGIKR